MTARPVYLVRLRPAPNCRVPDAVALRRLLKALGRCYGLECVGVREAGDVKGRRGEASVAGRCR